jgi:hypothetical protein
MHSLTDLGERLLGVLTCCRGQLHASSQIVYNKGRQLGEMKVENLVGEVVSVL